VDNYDTYKIIIQTKIVGILNKKVFAIFTSLLKPISDAGLKKYCKHSKPQKIRGKRQNIHK